MEPWEVEEIACAQQYLVSIIGAGFDELEADSEKALKKLPRFDPKKAYDSSSQKHMVDSADLCDFSIIEANDLFMFSHDFVEESDDYLSSMASAGLGFVFDLAKSDKDARFYLLRTNYPCPGSFLTATLDYSPYQIAAQTHRGADDDLAKPNAGYRLYRSESGRKYRPIKHNPQNYFLWKLGTYFGIPQEYVAPACLEHLG
jgi:hypothetical protein